MILILNEVLPEDLRAELEKEARERDVTLNDVAGRILHEHYGIYWDPSGAPYREMAQRFKLRVPESLHQAIRLDAASKGTVRGIVLSILASHYGLAAISPQRRPRRAVS